MRRRRWQLFPPSRGAALTPTQRSAAEQTRVLSSSISGPPSITSSTQSLKPEPVAPPPPDLGTRYSLILRTPVALAQRLPLQCPCRGQTPRRRPARRQCCSLSRMLAHRRQSDFASAAPSPLSMTLGPM